MSVWRKGIVAFLTLPSAAGTFFSSGKHWLKQRQGTVWKVLMGPFKKAGNGKNKSLLLERNEKPWRNSKEIPQERYKKSQRVQPINCQHIFQTIHQELLPLKMFLSGGARIWLTCLRTLRWERVYTVIFDRDQIAFHLFPLVGGIVCKGNRG